MICYPNTTDLGITASVDFIPYPTTHGLHQCKGEAFESPLLFALSLLFLEKSQFYGNQLLLSFVMG